MDLLCQNGFLVQHLNDCPHGVENKIHTCEYNGLSARNSNPLSMFSDRESQELSKEAEWRVISEHKYALKEFISDPDILIRYIKTCQKRNIPIRLLFVESDYNEEVWRGPEIPKRFLGYEYNTIPIDNQIITDFSWYRPLSPFIKHVNPWGLFSSLDDVMRFKNAYDSAFENGEIGDGDMETHIFCLFDVQLDDLLRHLLNEGNSDQNRNPVAIPTKKTY